MSSIGDGGGSSPMTQAEADWKRAYLREHTDRLAMAAMIILVLNDKAKLTEEEAVLLRHAMSIRANQPQPHELP
jgi:hypothetical protein